MDKNGGVQFRVGIKKLNTMVEEQEITMAASIRTIDCIGDQAIEVFEAAGFYYVHQLKNFDGEDRKLWQAIEAKRSQDSFEKPASHWKRLMTRCINIIYRARSAEATPFVPHAYMCPITLDWFDDPVVTAAGQSYSRETIEKHLEASKLDPMTGVDISGRELYANVAMRHAVEHYRLHHQRFCILT